MNNCPHCWNALIDTVAGLACPTCGKVIRFARMMESQPNTTPEQRNAWEGVAVVALIFAGAVVIDRLLEA
jgi:GTP-dependent phosphoenolpyruvate carboxykinase